MHAGHHPFSDFLYDGVFLYRCNAPLQEWAGLPFTRVNVLDARLVAPVRVDQSVGEPASGIGHKIFPLLFKPSFSVLFFEHFKEVMARLSRVDETDGPVQLIVGPLVEKWWKHGKDLRRFDHFPKVTVICSHQLNPLSKRPRGFDVDSCHFIIGDHTDLFPLRLRPDRFGPVGENRKVGSPYMAKYAITGEIRSRKSTLFMAMECVVLPGLKFTTSFSKSPSKPRDSASLIPLLTLVSPCSCFAEQWYTRSTLLHALVSHIDT